ncbi:type VII secretion protein EssA [Bacillus sp. A301a_S52]|jgi:type VII secretion protein EssA|nr:type VII secretion protein EssA [Bacillus sp. A301a_S52]
MKRSKLLSIILLIVVVFSITTVVYGEGNTPPEPNIYEKREINIINNGRDSSIQRDQLPQEQLGLTFEERELTESDLLEGELFQVSVIETNTITTKSDQLGLFSKEDIEIRRQIEDIGSEQSDYDIVLVLIVAVVVIILLMFVIIIPKLKPAPPQKKIKKA